MKSDEPSGASPKENSEAPALDEFQLIRRFFDQDFSNCAVWPSQGIGDDCAFLDIGQTRIAVSTDMMSLGTHFLEDADPYRVGRKALEVNLSDLAAAGAVPQACFLSISLPKIDVEWISGFAKGFADACRKSNCPLRGGDTTKSPDGSNVTSFSVTVMGELPAGKGLTRRGAKPGDDVWVSGTPGDAFAGLGAVWGQIHPEKDDMPYLMGRLELPSARLTLGRGLLDLASACADVSDGLVGDLGHILKLSKVSAVLEWPLFPKSEAVARLSEAEQQRCVLSGGDDYELVFTAPQKNRKAIQELGEKLGVRVTRIGTVVSEEQPFKVIDKGGKQVSCYPSFNHFA